MDQVKYFTPQEARQTLPLVKKIVTDILSAGAELRDLSVQIGTNAENDPRVIKILDDLEDHFVELEDLGCSYKDWNFTMGLVDFPAIFNGEEVCLCWRSDEEDLLYFHGLEEGYPGRKPIPDNLK